MKKLFIIGLVLFSCQSKNIKANKDLEKNLFTYFKENMKTADSTNHLDSLRIVKFDTITARSILYKKIMSIYDQIDANQKWYDADSNVRYDEKQMIRLEEGLSTALYNNSLDDYNKTNSEMISIQNKDSMLIRKANSLEQVFKTTDSTTLLYFQVKCLIQYQRKDLSVKRDTVYSFLNPEKSIVRSEDIFE